MVDKAEKKLKPSGTLLLQYMLYCIQGKPMPRGHNPSLSVRDLLTTVKKKQVIWCTAFLREQLLSWQEKPEEGTHANVCAATPMGFMKYSSEQFCPGFSAKLLKKSVQTDHI